MKSRIDQLRLPKWEREELMPENLKQPDIDFVYLSFNLIPLPNGSAIAPGAIVTIDYRKNDDLYAICMHGGKEYHLSPAQMVEVGQTIRQRTDDAKAVNRAALKEQKLVNYQVDQELGAELRGLISKPVLTGRN